MRQFKKLAQGAFFLFSALIALAVFGLHVKLHGANDCAMTYMWRILQFMEIPLEETNSVGYRYSLIVYNEGWLNQNKSVITKKMVPVLFIPGSGGSSRQVRSMATILQNKTEMRHKPYEFRCFALDFDDQLSFASGRLLEAQRDYAIDAVIKIREMLGDERKIIVLAHSLGGAVTMSMLNHPRFNPSWIDLIITKASPLNDPPMYVDHMTRTFYNDFHKFYDAEKDGKLAHIGFASYSSGLKDIQVPDRLAALDGIHHRPAWAVPGCPDTGTDHLCILWCNLLVRHASRIIVHYADTNFPRNRTGREVVNEFFREETHHRIETLFGNGTRRDDLPRLHVGTELSTLIEKKFAEFHFHPEPASIVYVTVKSSCAKFVSVLHPNHLLHKKKLVKGEATVFIYRAEVKQDEDLRIIVSGPDNCEFRLEMISSPFALLWRWYEFPFLNQHLLFTSLMMFLLRFAVIEKLIELDLFRRTSVLTYGTLTLMLLVIFNSNLTPIAPTVVGLVITYLYWNLAHLLVNIINRFAPGLLRKSLRFKTSFFITAGLILGAFYGPFFHVAVILAFSWKINARAFLLCALNVVPLISAVLYAGFNPFAYYRPLFFVLTCAYILIYLLTKDLSFNLSSRRVPNTVSISLFLLLALRIMSDESDVDDEMSGSTALGEDAKRHARAQHNALERRRRDNIKDMYTSLRDAVPEMNNERASRAVILKRAIETIEDKQQERDTLTTELQSIEEKNQKLLEEIEKLKKKKQESQTAVQPSALPLIQPIPQSFAHPILHPIAQHPIQQQNLVLPQFLQPATITTSTTTFSTISTGF
ncbi:unnamed protein product [Caenorhabditis auriculariae]|uniref:GPI inositol-deacylase n=1 Tax=Caenorhabditis auriculariae TaxID=2777116 RepID=A0A8S1HS60_9PELO|nr:unnamed protein product [Caenorhabditis auriculariae]